MLTRVIAVILAGGIAAFIAYTPAGHQLLGAMGLAAVCASDNCSN
jgi:hypothetical protein